MDLRLLTPFGALFALSALAPLALFAVRRRRLHEIAVTLGVPESPRRSWLPLVLALAAVPVLLGVAAAQPVIERTRTTSERQDVQVFVVLDVSRSMLASAKAGSPTRFDRARSLALALRDELPDVPFGLASLTDWLLPHLLPTTDARVFGATLARAIDVDHPPPSNVYLTFATNLNALRSVPELNYFPRSAEKRVLVVLTDGETQPIQRSLARPFERRPRITTIFVHLWNADERIYETGVAEGGYASHGQSARWLARAAELVGGQVFSEQQAGDVARAVRAAVGEGETIARTQESARWALMPYVALAALVPIGFVLLRRNIWWAGALRVPRPLARAPRAAKVSEPRGVAQPG